MSLALTLYLIPSTSLGSTDSLDILLVVKWHLALGGDSYSASISRILARLRGEGLKRLRLYAVDQVLQLPQVPGVKVEPDLSFVNMSAPDIEDK